MSDGSPSSIRESISNFVSRFGFADTHRMGGDTAVADPPPAENVMTFSEGLTNSISFGAIEPAYDMGAIRLHGPQFTYRGRTYAPGESVSINGATYVVNSSGWIQRAGSTDLASDAPAAIPEKPSVTMLRHMATPEAGTDARTALAIAAEDALGYTPLRKDTNAPSRLQRILRELEIDAFDTGTVAQYKSGMQQHHQALAMQRDEERVARETAGMDDSHRNYYRAYLQQKTVVTWVMTPLAGYSKPVPEFVLHKALQIKERCPDAQFFVDELREQVRTLDPFLLVKLGEEEYAIEVWDEPEFEKTL